jgi:hypothetical protein
VVATVAGLVILAGAGPATANTPLRGWEQGSAMSLLDALLLFGGGTLAIAVVITLLVMAPSAISRSRDQGTLSWWGQAQWFGGELGAGSAERPQLEAAAVAAGAGPDDLDDLDAVAAGGGASARW